MDNMKDTGTKTSIPADEKALSDLKLLWPGGTKKSPWELGFATGNLAVLDCVHPTKLSMGTRLSIKIPTEWLIGSYNYLKTQFIKGFGIFIFEMKRDSLNVSIELYTADIERTLEFLSTTYDASFWLAGNDYELRCPPSEFTGACSESSQITGFLYLNYHLMKILHFRRWSEITRKYKCKTTAVRREKQVHVTVSGADRESVNCCTREIEELYYSNILAEFGRPAEVPDGSCGQVVKGETKGPRSDRPGACMAYRSGEVSETARSVFVEISSASDGRVVVFGKIGEIPSGYRGGQWCTVNLLVSFEMGNFICGKKMGKIHRIDSPYLRVTAVDRRAKDQAAAGGMFSFNMQGPLGECLRCYGQLFDEFPVEMCFSIDRKHHKRIIGLEGNAIQNIMKKYNFYVKFLSFKEMGQLGLEGNVILKTPRKNRGVLEEAKREIQGRVGEERARKSEFEGMSVEMEGRVSFECISKFVEMNMQKERWY